MEQILKEFILRILKEDLSQQEKFDKIKQFSKVMGRRSCIALSKHLPYTHYQSTENILKYLSKEFWQFVFGITPPSVTQATPNQISFKIRNFSFLDGISASDENAKDQALFFELFKRFIDGLLMGVLSYFKLNSEISIIYQNNELFIDINCDQNY